MTTPPPETLEEEGRAPHEEGAGERGGSPPEDDPDRVLGASDAGRAASAFIVALNRAARSFLLYDPANEAIRAFLTQVRDTAQAYFEGHGDMDLKVRPFELTVGGEAVYVDRDRERSLAFRLYRDGVRRVVIEASVTWHELIKLLEVISVRYTGIRQAEDDMVVLLWKAGFQNIQIEAVEGVVEDDAGDVALQPRTAGHYVSAPDDFDLPPPLLPPGPAVTEVAVPDHVLEELRKEDASSELPAQCVRLAEEVLDACGRGWLTFDEAIPVLRELRDFLLTEGTLEPLIEVIRRLLRAQLPSEANAAREDLATSFLEVRALLRLLKSVPRDMDEAPTELLALLQEVPGDHLATLFQAVELDRNDHVRRVAGQLVAWYVPTRSAWMLDQLGTVDDIAARQIINAIARVHPEETVELIDRMANRVDEDIHFDCIDLLAGLPPSPSVVRHIAQYTTHATESVRVKALTHIGDHAVRVCFPVVLERLQREPMRYSEFEASSAGEAMARSDPEQALARFREWTEPPGFFQYVPPGHRTLLFASIAGLVFLHDDEVEPMIRTVERTAEKSGDEEVARAAIAAMIRRRRMQRTPERR